MRKLWLAAASVLVLAGPAAAQVDVGRLLDQVVPQRGPDPRDQAERDRRVYQQGRRDEEVRREEFRRREAERRFDGPRDDDRRREFRRDEERRREEDRLRFEQERNGRPRY